MTGSIRACEEFAVVIKNTINVCEWLYIVHGYYKHGTCSFFGGAPPAGAGGF